MNSHTETMLCGTCVEPGAFALEARPKPASAPEGWVLVDIAAVGLCGTDYHILEGKHPFLQYPRVIGHELSGHVAEDAAGWRAGELVVINPYLSCGECRACKRGKPNCCMSIEVLGVHRDGGLCARIAVPAGNLYAAGDLRPEQAAMVEFLAIGAHAVSRSGIAPGDRVLVTGAGPIGLGTALFARLEGAEVHLMDLSPARLEQAQRLFGFEHLHVAGEPILEGDLSDGFDLIFDATGNAKAIEAGFPLLAHGSTYVLVSVVKDRITFEDAEFHKRETRIIGSRNALKADFERVMVAIAAGDIDTDALLSERIALAELPERFPLLAKDRDALIKAVVTPLR
ncbi:zinc-binding alcohol dehydrogenase family protein [Alloyangia pacifica]|uniref:2-desacetyl-2-hydroxyethyl bacteriochlorophyllide A dehydrogenase n=1 Tax=Alloyangia pacifica TaxID=311180 RepID=A0A1I6WIK0_9RHOB|nr:zinc-binding alcohol dehydrogenase family protein [Alloyangia pacifica]SDI79801.1 2-desacetyl-2-hydroxyethyl bacteriochlorophyllide A dehydrogenase [Alloyangia pacifica]SFT25807.1 2-desacetyl-2-hydroxyethyl bacteriochlorophyllide A dehydrogenase [Alloyangia pacifica]